MGSLTLKQIKTLMHRNYLLTIRKKGQTAQMIGWPIYFVVLLVILKVAAYKPTTFPPMPNDNTLDLSTVNPDITAIYIAPNITGVDSFRRNLLEHSLINNRTNIQVFSDQAEMDVAYRALPIASVVGILFSDSSMYDYSLRFGYTSVPGSGGIDRLLTNCRSPNFFGGGCPANNYLVTGFSALQAIVDEILIQNFNPSYEFPNITLQMMPRDTAVFNAETFTVVTAIYLVFAFSPFMLILLVNVVAEKERKIKEAMKVMGLGNFALWFSWSLTYGGILFCMAIVMSIIAKFGTLFEYSDFFVIFFLFFLYGVAMEMLGFMLTAFFVNARTAGTAGGFINVLLGLLYLIVAFVPNIPIGAIWALNLFAPTGFAIAIGEVALSEVTGDGTNFSNLWSGFSGKYPVGITFVMLTIDIFLYFILILYFDKVIPGEYGQREPFYFFLKPSYWFPSKDRSQTPPLIATDYPKEDFEPVSDDLKGKEAIRFSHITKVYKPVSIFSSDKTTTTAVNNFSLDIYEGQITALLGHNGAGKTTLFNILTGFVETTSGQATVFNHNISNSNELEQVRRMTGFCPQHNILFDILSVKEHLQVFAGIKGIRKDVVDAEVDRIIKLIGLQDQTDTFAKNLSGGQKRKLSVGIAVMGDPRILILDEPTAGMDPYSRHTMWNVLRERKGNRVTLLTTHFMDEADILADRKAIISRGKLRCVGSSLFLKNRFGIGYHLGVVTKSAGDHSALTDYVIGVIPGAELQRHSGFELGYVLPITEVGKFSKLFSGFDSDGETLDVQSYGVSMTTLEEVFLKIGEEDEVEEEETGERVGLQASNNEIVKRLRSQKSLEIDAAAVGHTNGDVAVPMREQTKFNPDIGQVDKPSPWKVFFALVKIQLITTIRSPGFLLFGFIIPLGLAIGGAAVLNIPSTAENTVNPPSINLTSGLAFEYPPLLYKNSTDGAIRNFLSNLPVSSEVSSLKDLCATRRTASYIATDVRQFEDNQINYRALYNVTATHGIPAIFNIMSQTVLQAINSSAPSLHISSKRWPAVTEIFAFNGGIFGGVLMSAFAVIMVTGIPIIIPVQERELKIRSQLRVSGVGFYTYWFAHFFVTFVWYVVIVIGFIIGIVAFNVEALSPPGAIGALILNLIGCGMASIITSFCASFLYNKHETASSTWFNVVQLATFLPYLIVSLLDQLAASGAALILNVIFVLLIPYYSAFSALYYITKIFTERVQAGLGGTVPPASLYFDWSNPMVPFSILVSYLQFFGLVVLLRIIDVRANGGHVSDAFGIRKKRGAVDAIMMSEYMDVANEDDDVKEERKRVNDIMAGNMPDSEPVVVMQNMRKEFAKRSSKGICSKKKKEEKIKVAVDNLSISVHPGEVMGLLGPNGAGKTTAISVMTGDHGPTRGKVMVSGYDILSNESEAFHKMGYCSQDNPLWELITLKEHLEMYAVAQGVQPSSIDMTINNYVDALDIREHLNKRAKQLSGGTKRKLCFAMAMMGNPQVVLLDEPSTGMDPKTKRFMWDTISTAFERSNRGAVLTTHYMDEADALCSRVAIMVLGQLRCIGSTQHLKSKFGQGYMLEIKLKEHQENDKRLNQFVSELFENVSKPEQFSHRFVYKIAQKDVTSLAKVFGSLEENKKELGIEEYCFSQATLEQVFLQFAKEQDERESEELE